jgi:hypothetical protein
MYLLEEGWKDGGDPTWEHHRGRLYVKTWTKGLSVWQGCNVYGKRCIKRFLERGGGWMYKSHVSLGKEHPLSMIER